MPQLSTEINEKPLTLLLYGVSGSGKTTLWGRLAEFNKFRPIYCADWDLRLGSLRATLKPDLLEHIYYDEYRDQQIGGEAYIRLEAISRGLDNLDKRFFPKLDNKFKTIVIDSGTFLMDGIMARVLMLEGKTPKDNPQLQNYLAQQSCLRELIQRFTSCGRNFIFTAHEDTDKDEVTGRMFKNLALTGKSAQKTPGYFNELWHAEVSAPKPGEEANFNVRTRSDVIYSARTSYSFLKTIEKQTDIWQKIVNGK